MKAGRNDPCPCGSGKKYKKCCLAQDRQERLEARLEPPRRRSVDIEEEDAFPKSYDRPGEPFDPELIGAEWDEEHLWPDDEMEDDAEYREDAEDEQEEADAPPDPLEEARDALWDKFEASDYEEQTAIFLGALDTPGLLDDGLAFGMLEVILRGARKRGEGESFEILVRALEERLPKIFAESDTCYVSWMVDVRAAHGRFDELAPLARELAAYAGSDIDIFNLALNCLAYHCDLPTLVEMMRIGWPGVRESANILPWGVEEFVDQAYRYEMLHFCGESASPSPDDAELIARLERYGDEVDREFVTTFISSVTGEVRQSAVPGADRVTWCHRLCLEFLGHLVREQGVRPGRADLASATLADYLLRRLTRELRHSPRLYDPGRRPPRRKGRRGKAQARTVHVLCPDAKTLEPYLADQVHFLSSRYHTVAAVTEVIPAWLCFLESRALADSEESRNTLEGLARLHADLLKLWKGFPDDPSLHQAAVLAWQAPQPSPQQT